MTEPSHGGHEPTEVHPRPIALFGAALAAGLVLVLVVAYLMMHFFLGRADRADRASPDFTVRQAPAARAVPVPGVPLQSDPIADMRALRAREEAALSSYGWVDREAGLVRVPIQRAMDMLLERSRSGKGRR